MVDDPSGHATAWIQPSAVDEERGAATRDARRVLRREPGPITHCPGARVASQHDRQPPKARGGTPRTRHRRARPRDRSRTRHHRCAPGRPAARSKHLSRCSADPTGVTRRGVRGSGASAGASGGAPGPGRARTSRGPETLPQRSQVRWASTSPPQSLWLRTRAGRTGAGSWRSPHCIRRTHGPEVQALVGEAVLGAAGRSGRDLLEHAVVDELRPAATAGRCARSRGRPGSRRSGARRGTPRAGPGSSSARRRPRASGRSSRPGCRSRCAAQP